MNRAPRVLRWRPLALADREAIMTFVAQDNVAAAIELDLQFEAKAELARQRPTLYRAGRMKGTRELVVRPSYVMVYRVLPNAVEFLRVLHTSRQWPSARGAPDVGPLS